MFESSDAAASIHAGSLLTSRSHVVVRGVQIGKVWWPEFFWPKPFGPHGVPQKVLGGFAGVNGGNILLQHVVAKPIAVVEGRN